MKIPMKQTALLLLLLPLLAVSCFAQATTLSVTVATEASMTVTTSTTTFTESGGVNTFGNFTATTNFTYRMRTTKVGGTGKITVQITSDFAAGGPSVASPPAGDTVTFTCTAATGTACSTSNASTTTPGNVVTFGADGHSTQGASPDAGTVTWTIPNDPIYKTGSYTATATFTISST